MKVKITTPGSGVLPVAVEKELSIDLGKVTYQELKTQITTKYGPMAEKIMERLKAKNWIKQPEKI
ncbi:MAG TPA: hypothetical protein ENH82_07655 [bacterium]|nr:hypothetical protein [bacterium]